LLPQAAIFGTLFLAFATAVPSPTEARIAGLQVPDLQPEVRTNCTIQPVGRAWIRGAPQCSGPSALPPLLRRVNITGKSSAALAADLHCRKSPWNVSQFTHKPTGCLPHAPASHRIIDVKRSDLAEWPADGFEPVPDRGMIETFTVGRLPDG
jgi:hypothetical protein